MREDRQNTSVLVTGGASGIGAALVRALLARGHQVVVLDRQRPSAEHQRLTSVLGDVTDPGANDEAVELASTIATGGLIGVIGNAGVHDGGIGVEDLSGDELGRLGRHLLQVNVLGYLQVARAAATELRRRGGRIVFTLSDASFVAHGVGAGVCYTVSKHAALGAVRALAAELAPDVPVNAVAPGGVLTGLRAPDPADVREQRDVFADPAAVERQVRGVNPMGAMLRAEQLVPHYLFLLDGAAAGMTGQVLRPDGGLELV